jgi:hypothetical protein
MFALCKDAIVREVSALGGSSIGTSPTNLHLEFGFSL